MPQTRSSLHVNKIAIVGNPNVGKSVLFNQLTQDYSLVANAPYTTVAVHRADVVFNQNRYQVIDTPGIASLDIQSEDGLVTRSILVDEHPELIVFCLDANNLMRSLLLLSQVAELGVPLVCCLNFLDESRLKGIEVNITTCEKLLGVPVVETVASEGRGIRELRRALDHAAVPCLEQLQYGHIVEDALDELSSCFPEAAAPSDAVLLLMLLQDAWIGAFITTTYGEQVMQQTTALVARAHDASQRDLVRIILRERNRWAADIAGKITEKIMIRPGHSGVRIARLARHPVWGWFMLAGVVYITFVLVGQVAAGMLAVAIEEVFFAPLNEMIAASIKSAFLEDFLIGPYGILTTGLENAIGTVLPILTMFFLVLNFLEDVGYIPNLAVLCNRLFRRVGLSGKAILPVVLGFGCKTMATLATKMLDSKKERYIAIFLIAFAIPCSSQLGVNLAILALFPFKAFVIVFGVLAAAELVVGLVLNRLLPEEQETDFIMELPPIRLPQVKNLLIKTYYRLKWFLMEAIPLFVAGALVLFVLEKTGMLGLIKQTVFPVIVSFLDLPIVTVDAFLLCLARHEAGAVILLEMVRDGTLDYIQTLVSVVMVTCFVPCFANVMAMIKELGLVRALVMVLVIIVCSIIIGGGVNWVLRI